METFTVNELSELTPVVERVHERVKELGQSETGAVVLALIGDLGAGKTTFMQLLARQLGVSEGVVSPTFVVMKHYELSSEGLPFENLYHLDAYRIETADEMRPLGFEALLNESGALIAIEWADRIASLLPAHTLTLTFTLDADTRTINLT